MMQALLLMTVSTPSVRADSVIEIVGKLKTMRDATIELFSVTAASMKEAGADKDAEQIEQWSNDWLSVLGVQKGLTGLVKDFVLNYLGRSSYHNSNGPLVDAIKSVADAFPKRTAKASKADVEDLRANVLDV